MSQALPAPTLRLATERDAPAIQAIYAPYVRDTCISFETEPPGVEEIRRRIGNVLPRWPWLVSERGGEILAYAYASEHRVRAAFRWAVDVAVYVRDGEQRRGHGRALYAALIPLLRLQGFCHAYAAIYVPNPPSVALHEAMGFRPFATFAQVGYKQGGWRDVGWWHLALREPPARPEEPLGTAAARALPGWEAIFRRENSGQKAGSGVCSASPPKKSPMKNLRLLLAAGAACILTAAVFASDPTGTWKWSVTTQNGEIETTAKLAAKDGAVTGTYSNSFGDGAISEGTVKDDDITFKVVRDFNGTKFTLQYQGKITGDAIKGTIAISGMQGGGDGQKLAWDAKRDPAAKP